MNMPAEPSPVEKPGAAEQIPVVAPEPQSRAGAAHATDAHTAVGHAAGGHETTDLRIVPIVKAGVGLACVVGLCLFGLSRLTASFEHAAVVADPQVSPMSGSQIPPSPRLQTQPRDSLAILRSQEQFELTHYRWADRQKNLVELPIERAMQLLAERGIPEPAPTATPSATAPNATTPSAQEAPK